jgi:hypothetical protein
MRQSFWLCSHCVRLASLNRLGNALMDRATLRQKQAAISGISHKCVLEQECGQRHHTPAEKKLSPRKERKCLLQVPLWTLRYLRQQLVCATFTAPQKSSSRLRANHGDKPNSRGP